MQPVKVIELTNKLAISDLEKMEILLSGDERIKPAVKKLFAEILKNRLTGKDNKKEHLLKHISGQHLLTENQFRKICFELLQKIEQLLPLIQLEKNKAENKIQLLDYLANEATENFYEERWNKIKTEFKENILLSTHQSFYNYSIELSRYNFLVDNPSKAKANNIMDASAALDEYYILQKLKLICHAVNESKFTTYKETPKHHEAVIEMAKTDANPLIKLYLYIYSLLSDPEKSEVFTTIQQELETNDSINENEWRTIFQYVINYCIIQLNQGNSDFEQKLFDIYITYLQKINDKIFSPFRYKNIINLALKLRKYDFAAGFIEDYGKKLPAELQQTSIAFNKAKLYYELKNYNLVIESLQHVKTDELTFHLSAKVLLVKTFYDKKEYIFLESFLESFRMYVLRSKQMNTAVKQTHFEFIKIVKKLVTLDYKSQKEIHAFAAKISKQENLTDKGWLLEKINAL